jgi:thymidine phosphorylase
MAGIKNAKQAAKVMLESGLAYKKMQQIINEQGHKEYDFSPAELSIEITAKQNGFVIKIDNFQLAKIASRAGAPMDKHAGVDLNKKLGDEVNKGDVLYRIYAEFPADFKFAQTLAEENNGYSIGSADDICQSYMEI